MPGYRARPGARRIHACSTIEAWELFNFSQHIPARFTPRDELAHATAPLLELIAMLETGTRGWRGGSRKRAIGALGAQSASP